MVKVFVAKDSLDKLCKVLYDFGLIEVKRARDFIQQGDEFFLMDNAALIKESSNLKERINKLVSLLDISSAREEGILPVDISIEAMNKIKDSYEQIISEVENINQHIKDNQQKINELTIHAELLNAIEERGLSLENFRGSVNITVAAGIVPKDYSKDIRAYSETGVLIEIAEEFSGYVFIFCVSLKEKEGNLLNFLRSVRFKKIALDYKADSIGEAIESLTFDMWKLREENAELRRRLGDIKKRYGSELVSLLPLIEENEKVYQQMGKFLVSQTGYVVTGWVPGSRIKKLENKLKEFSGIIYLEKELAEDMIRTGFDIKNVPSYPGHKLMRPFEKILKFYGTPAYRHIDPTLIMSLSFVIMFGMMFGDLGHGLSLLALALGLGFFKALRDVSCVLALCGISGAVFGILFGSYFGKESIIKPLWFNPAHSPEKFLLISIGLGVAVITLGIILNIVQNIKNKNIKGALFGQWGIVSIIFYWLILYVGISLFWYNLNISLIWILIIFFAPLLIITLGNLLWRGEEDMAEIIFSPVEIVLGLLTNTISFVRVAAFGLAHAALGACVYLVAYSMGDVAGLKESLIVEGNVGIILFEGLIVFIQGLRLEFYEFFSKFFQSQGVEFKPLKERG